MLEIKGIFISYIQVIMDMYNRVVTNVRTISGYSSKLTIGLYQKSVQTVLSAYLVMLVMNNPRRDIQDDFL